MTLTSVSPTAAGSASLIDTKPLLEPTLEERIRERIASSMRATPQAARIISGLLARDKAFGEVDPDDCTETVEFELIDKPTEVSFRMSASRKVGVEAYTASLFCRFCGTGVALSTSVYIYVFKDVDVGFTDRATAYSASSSFPLLLERGSRVLPFPVICQ
jgi:hypothetical protein